jgi:transcription elongation GreA/GreB family factor
MFFGSGRHQTKGRKPAFTKVFAAVNKSDLRTAILQQLRRELDRSAGAAALARDEAISEESRAENKWDTHSQEAAYLAEGQARQAATIGESIEFYLTLPLPDYPPGAAIAAGAVVELEDQRGRRSWYVIGPRAGGLEVDLAGQTVLVVTPQSPLGRALLGKRTGDPVTTPGRGSAAAQRIVSVT